MTVIKALNLAVRFFLEISALVALGYWGFHAGSTLALKILLGLGISLLAAFLWGVFASPKASIPLKPPLSYLFELIWFGCAVVALSSLGQTILAFILYAIFLINRVLIVIWGQ